MDPTTTGARGHGADEYLRAQHRIALLFDALGRAQGRAEPEFPARVMRVVARHATARPELERHGKKLADAGSPFALPEVFDLVADRLPGWCPWLEGPGAPQGGPYSASSALRRLVTQGEGQTEKGKRFAELARAAARQAARGSIGKAASVVSEAERLIGEAAAPSEGIEAARVGGFDQDLEIFRPFAGARYAREPLKLVLGFFRALRPIALLQAMAEEPRRERRHLILALLEVHGPATRREALDLLRSEPESEVGMSEEEAYVRRNLIYLLRRVPRLDDVGLDEEVAILTRHTAVDHPSLVVKEAIGALGQLPGRRAERALSTLKESLDRMVGRPTPAGASEDLRVYLDRVAAALARRETGSPIRPTSPVRSSGPEGSRLPEDGLPSLLYELAETAASGALSFEDASHARLANLGVQEGRMVSARTGRVAGADAVYALLETFQGGTYTWNPRSAAGDGPRPDGEPLELASLVREGLRRRDELDLARDLVPDAAVFRARVASPRPCPGETDGLLTRDVWAAASSGRAARDAESATAVDPYRVRRLFLHWLDEGVLEEATPSTSAR